MKAIRTVLSCIRKADQAFDLFHAGDKIAVGVSGGKDSVVLVYALSLYQKFSQRDFEIYPITLDLGFPDFDISPVQEYLKGLNLNLEVIDKKEVYQILQIQQVKQKTPHLPCSICSRMKKAGINEAAKRLGCNKVAFAHHIDDAKETLFMNLLLGTRFATFSPRMHLDNVDITFIRPFTYVKEKDIKRVLKEENIPIAIGGCPSDKHTRREDVKLFLKDVYKEFSGSEEAITKALTNYQKLDLWGEKLQYQIDNEGLTLHPLISVDDTLDMVKVRREVFENEYHISYEDEFVKDVNPPEDTTYLIKKNDVTIGTIRYRILENKTIKIERFAILKEYRHQGYGTKAISYLIERIKKEFTPVHIILNSIETSAKIYENIGFKKIGSSFLEADIPHIKMYLDL